MTQTELDSIDSQNDTESGSERSDKLEVRGDYDEIKQKINVNQVAMDRETLPLHQLLEEIQLNADLYASQFEVVYKNFITKMNKYFENPESLNTKQTEELAKLVRFICRAAQFFRDLTSNFHEAIFDLIQRFGTKICHELRHSILTSLMQLTNKGILSNTWQITKVVSLFDSTDKVIRSIIFKHIVNLCKKTFRGTGNSETKGKIKALFLKIIKSSQISIAKRIQDILAELQRRNVWRDKQVVFIFAEGLLSKESKVNIRCCCFFLNEQILNDAEEDQSTYNLLSRKQLKKSLTAERRKSKNFESKSITRNTISFDAIDQLPDPQQQAEKLFAYSKSTSLKFVYKIQNLRVVCRILTRSSGQIPGLHSHLSEFINKSSSKLNALLGCIVEITNETSSQDECRTVILALMDKLVSDKNDAEVISMGIFAINAMIKKFPQLLKEQDETGEYKPLNENTSLWIGDIVHLRKYKKKVVRAAVAEFFNLIKKEKMSKLKASNPHNKTKIQTDDEKIKKKFDNSDEDQNSSEEESMPSLESGDEFDEDGVKIEKEKKESRIPNGNESDGSQYSGESDQSKIQVSDEESSESSEDEDAEKEKGKEGEKGISKYKKKKHEKLHKKTYKDKNLSVAGTRTNKLNERNKDMAMVKQKLKRKRHEADAKVDVRRAGKRDKNFKGHCKKKNVQRKKTNNEE